MATDRERFLALLYTGPLLSSDAIVVLAGEDATPRLAVAAQLLRSGGASRILVTGGRHEPPRHVGATACAAQLMGMGIAHDRITTDCDADDGAQNTWQQALRLAGDAIIHHWGRVLLVASSYHLARAYLSVVKALTDAEMTEKVHVLPVPASASAWYGKPAGCDETRAKLFDIDLAKIDEYGAKGHVATYAEGIEYIRRWDGR